MIAANAGASIQNWLLNIVMICKWFEKKNNSMSSWILRDCMYLLCELLPWWRWCCRWFMLILLLLPELWCRWWRLLATLAVPTLFPICKICCWPLRLFVIVFVCCCKVEPIAAARAVSSPVVLVVQTDITHELRTHFENSLFV